MLVRTPDLAYALAPRAVSPNILLCWSSGARGRSLARTLRGMSRARREEEGRAAGENAPRSSHDNGHGLTDSELRSDANASEETRESRGVDDEGGTIAAGRGGRERERESERTRGDMEGKGRRSARTFPSLLGHGGYRPLGFPPTNNSRLVYASELCSVMHLPSLGRCLPLQPHDSTLFNYARSLAHARVCVVRAYSSHLVAHTRKRVHTMRNARCIHPPDVTPGPHTTRAR